MAREHNKKADRVQAPAKKSAPPKSSKTQKKPKKQPTNKESKPSSKGVEEEESSSESPGTAKTTKPASKISPQELRRQQALLNIFSDTFADVLALDTFTSVLQEVKQALYNRDFDKAFGREEYLEVYAARWSPTRALCYAKVLDGIREQLEELLVVSGGDSDGVDANTTTTTTTTKTRPRRPLRMLSIGGGAAEIVAFASLLSHGGDDNNKNNNDDKPEGSSNSTNSENLLRGDLHLVDTGPWAKVVSKLQQSLTTPPRLSVHASPEAHEANRALVDPATQQLRCTFTQQDALDLTAAQLTEAVLLSSGAAAAAIKSEDKLQGPSPVPGPVLVTLLFTLNELYTGGGIGRTTAFLRTLTACVPEGSLLLVVDSPGSYSEAAVGKGEGAEKKKYPMQWLLDHTLLTSDKDKKTQSRWVKLESHDSVWFRMAAELRYPFQLENMRYQMHLYKAVTTTTTTTSQEEDKTTG